MSFPGYADYRDAEAEWLPRLPTHWRLASLRWLSRRFSGGTPDKNSPEYWENGTIPWLNSGEVNQGLITAPSTFISDAGFANSSAKWIPAGALVMALAGQGKTKGMVAQLAFPATCNQSMAAIVPSAEVNARFLYWWLQSNYQNIRNMAGGDLRDGLNLDLLGEIPCPLPSSAEQSGIAAFLDRETAKIDALVEEQKRLIELLKEKRQAVISHAVTKGLDPSVPMKDSGVAWLGEVPAHWEVIALKREAEFVTSGARGWADNYSDNGELFLRIGNLTRDTIQLDLSDTQRVVVPESKETVRTRAIPGDLLFSITAYLGSVAVIPDGLEPAYVSQHVALVRLKGCRLVPEWAAYVAASHVGKTFLETQGYGGTKVQLSLTDVANLLMLLPEAEEQRAIVDYIEHELSKLDELTEGATSAVCLLQERRSALISAAVTGKIDVRGLAPRPEVTAA